MSITLEISALYCVNSDEVIVTLYPKNGNSSTYIGSQVTSGNVSLVYSSENSVGVITDITLQSVNISSDYADIEGKFNIIFNHPLRIIDLKVNGSVVISSITYSNSVDVLDGNVEIDSIGQNDALTQYEEFPEHEDEDENRDDITMLEELDPISLQLDFALENPVIKGHGIVQYSGGGNRYVPNVYGSIVEQDVNEAPWLTRCAVYCEGSAVNLLDNNDFHGITGSGYQTIQPVGFQASNTGILLTSNVTGDSYISTNSWDLRYRLGHWVSPTISCNPVAIDVTKPLTCAMFLGIYPQLSDKFLNAKNLTFKIKFYNNYTLLGSKDLNYLISNLLDSLYIVSNSVSVAEYPALTNKVSFEILLGSIIQGDDFIVRLLLPQIIQQNEITSFIRNANTRMSDIITIQQNDNINLESGGFIVRFTPDYTGYPITERCLFDTRGLTGQNGFVCSHKVDGTFDFTIYGQSGTYGLTSSVQSMNDETEIKVIYDLGEPGITGGNLPVRKIYKDKVQIATSSDIFTSPLSIEQDIFIGSKYDSTNIIGGQLTEFIVMRKFN